MEISLSLKSDHILVDGIWCSYLYRKTDCCTKCSIVLTCDVKMTPHTVHIFGLIFSQEKLGNWTSFLHGNCSYISELDARLLNHPNWTSITRVMVYFLGLPHAALF